MSISCRESYFQRINYWAACAVCRTGSTDFWLWALFFLQDLEPWRLRRRNDNKTEPLFLFFLFFICGYSRQKCFYEAAVVMFKLSTKCSVSNILFRGAPRQVIPVLLAACSVEFPLQLAPFYIFCWPETWRQICTELPFSPSATLLFCCTLFNTFSLPEDSRAAPDLIMQISRTRTHLSTRNSLSYVVSNKCKAVSWKAVELDRWCRLLLFQKLIIMCSKFWSP